MIDIPRNAGFPAEHNQAAEAKGIARQAKLVEDREDNRSKLLNALESTARAIVAIDPAQVAISQAISLKRIADALQPVNVKAEAGPWTNEGGRIVTVGATGPQQFPGTISPADPKTDIESLAGDMLNYTGNEVHAASDALKAGDLAAKIRRLASAVLRNAKPETIMVHGEEKLISEFDKTGLQPEPLDPDRNTA